MYIYRMVTTSTKRPRRARSKIPAKIEISWDDEPKDSKEAIIWAVALILGRRYYPPLGQANDHLDGAEPSRDDGR